MAANVLTEDDIPGASLAGRAPAALNQRLPEQLMDEYPKFTFAPVWQNESLCETICMKI